jgi:two-component system, OmpR family, sensor kinase
VQEIIGHAEEIGARTLGRRIVAYTDSYEYERLVQVLNTMLARIDAAFDAQQRFTADASHELRSPLTVLRGELELARRRERSPEEYQRVIDSSLEEVDRLTRVAEDLLTLARSDAGVLEARPRQTDLADQAKGVVERLATMAVEKGVRLEVNGLEAAVACVDTDLVRRLMWNLIANAIRFTPAGGHVAVTVTRDEQGVRLSVADNGPGIPESALPHIFDRFYRADEARTQGLSAAGTGLGLAIVQAIAELHGTRVTASHRAGGGARFSVVFPRISPEAAAPVAREAVPEVGRPVDEAPADEEVPGSPR